MQELNMMEVDQVVGGYRILAKTGDIFGGLALTFAIFGPEASAACFIVSGTFYLADAILSP